jgi:hypothetical protein
MFRSWLLGFLTFCMLVMVSTAMAASHSSTVVSPSAPDVIAEQRIVLHRNAGEGTPVLVSLGIPFPPGALTDPKLLRILDPKGNEIAASVKVVLRWYAKDNSIRAVRAQFRAPLTTDQETFYFAIGKPRQQELAGWPYETGLVEGPQGLRVPMVLGTLTPEWLCASLIAGPQQPASPNEAYAKYVSRQFEWASKLPVDDYSAWLFDRPSTLFKAYLRTGRFDYLQAADLSYRFYMQHVKREGLPMDPFCAGGWAFTGKPCDTKYVYIEPILLAVALTGNDISHDSATVSKMVTLWENGGWSGRPGPYTNPAEFFTERQAGLGLLATVSAYELTGLPHYLTLINQRVGWLYDHQHHNPDGLGDDGSWRSSWQKHEGDTWNPSTDVRGNSPWMSENIVDGLWHAWLVTGDKRIPEMITAYGRYLETHGWIDPKLITHSHDWRFPCSGPDGLIAWYWSSAHATNKALADIEDSEGWYSDAHNVELGLPVAAAYYFEQDPAQSALLKRRLEGLTSSYNTECASEAGTLRRFNWNNRGTGVVQWLIRQPAGSGLGVSTTAQVVR